MSNNTNPKSYLTLQINSLEALERLIGGDSQVEIDIRNSVVQKFTEKHLKAVVNSDAVQRAMTWIKTDVERQISDRLTQEIGTFKSDYYGRISDVKLRPEINTEIDRRVRDSINTIVSNAIAEAEKKIVDAAEIEKRIRSYVDHNINVRINQEVKARLDQIKASL
jgi:LPS O-antigen subunit length determinant protein (WzzB/FepE family)